MQIKDADCPMSVDERKEKVEAALATLKSLKYRVAELRRRCEALKWDSETQEGLMCDECRKLIESDEAITFKDSFGNVIGCYHKACFKAIWISQNSKFDCLSPSFLKVVGADK